MRHYLQEALSVSVCLSAWVQMAKPRLELMVFTEVDAGKHEATHNLRHVISMQLASRGQQASLPKHTNNDSWSLGVYPGVRTPIRHLLN